MRITKHALGAAFSLVSVSALAAEYTVTDIGTVSGVTTSRATGLSADGKVVGESGGHAFYWESGTIHDLGTLGGSLSVARGVRSDGTTVGRSDTGVGFDYHAFVAKGVMVDLGLGAQFSEANGISESGTIVGTSSFRGFRKLNGGLVETLPTLAGLTVANAVNGANVVTGGSTDASGNRRAYRWGSGSTLDELSLVAGMTDSEGYALNLGGTVVGVTDNGNGKYRAFRSVGVSTEELLGLGGMDTRARGINDSGVSVGSSWTGSSVDGSRAVLWDAGKVTATDLNGLIDGSSGWLLQGAYGINNLGQIVGYGTISGETHAFLLTPQAVPEPGCLAIFGAGLAVLAKRKRR